MWTPRFTQVDFFLTDTGPIAGMLRGLSIGSILAGALLLVLWIVLLRRAQTGLRLAIGLAALVLLPNAILSVTCLESMSSVHASWQLLLMLVPVLSMLGALVGVGWIALFWRALRPNECGSCRHELQESQAVCPECGWQRGRPRGVGQARWHAFVVCGAFAAFISLVVLRIGLSIPLEWTASFNAQVHAAPPGPTTSVYGTFRQRMAADDRHWDPIEVSGVSFNYDLASNVSFPYDTLDGDLSDYDAADLAGLEARLLPKAMQASSGATREGVEPLVTVQAEFVRGVRSLSAVRGTDQSPWPPAIRRVVVEVYLLLPPWSLLLANAASGPLAALALALLARRRHQKA